jgi:hypothetical protein
MNWQVAPWAASAPGDVPPGGRNFNLNDAARVFQPFLGYSRSILPDVPLWNPHLMAGRPFLADAQSAVFSPFHLPAYLVPFWQSLAAIAALKVFAAAFGAYLLGRALRMRFGGALLTGVAFGFSLWMVCWLSWPQSSVWALVPWLLLLTELLCRRPEPLRVAGLAAVVAAQFLGGHPESSRDAVLAAVVYFACRMLLSPRGGRMVLARSVAFGAALLLGTGLAAVVVAPFLDLLRDSADVTERSLGAGDRIPRRFLLGLFLPNYWGRPGSTSTNPLFTLFADRAFYTGALTLMLAAVAVVLRPARERIAVAAFGLVALAVVTGVPPFYQLVEGLPGQDALRVDRMTPLFAISVAVLAGWGLDDLTVGAPAARRRRVSAVVVVLLCLPILWMGVIGTLSLGHVTAALDLAWSFATPSATFFEHEAFIDVVRLGSLLEWVVLAGAGAALVTLRQRGLIAPPLFAALAVGLLATDLFKAGMGFNPVIPVRHAEQPATGAVRHLQARLPERFVAILPAMPNDLAMDHGLLDARGRDFPVDRRYKAFWSRNIAASAGNPASHLEVRELTARAVHALGMLGVAHILHDPAVRPPRHLGLRVGYAGRDARVLTNPGALPRAFVVDHQRIVAGEERALAAVGAPAFDARDAVVVERPLSGIPRTPPAAPARGRARIVAYEPERVVVDAAAARAGVVVLTDAYARGWKATVDGAPATIERVDYLLRGVVVPAGVHRVEFRYAPASWRIGWIVSALSLVLLLMTAATGWRRMRR